MNYCPSCALPIDDHTVYTARACLQIIADMATEKDARDSLDLWAEPIYGSCGLCSAPLDVHHDCPDITCGFMRHLLSNPADRAGLDHVEITSVWDVMRAANQHVARHRKASAS